MIAAPGKSTCRRLALTLLLLGALPALHAGEVQVAVASNFTAAMKEIATQFERVSGHRTRISYGSTGKLYAQILHGAPFELFLAADQRRPRLLEEQHQRGTERFTYAIGKLVLWSAESALPSARETLGKGDFRHLAIANPKTAPYGAAAMQVLKQLQLERPLARRLVRGDNIAQTRQFVATGNARLGFIALAQVALNDQGSRWLVPETLYDPIRQDALLLNAASENPAARALVRYLRSEAARDIIRKYGYGVERAILAAASGE